MLLEFYRIISGEKELRKLFKTTPSHGTYWKFVEENINQLNVKFVYLKSQLFQVLEELIKNDIPVVVSISSSIIGSEDETNHVVVVVGLKENHVVIHDPELGEYVEVEKNTFLEAWDARDCRIGYIVKDLTKTSM